MEIVSRHGHVILVDADDYRWLKWFRWSIINGYAISGGRLMHRIILDAPAGMLVDHKNRSRCDNRKSNLRLATRAQNNRNMPLVPAENKASSYRGVTHCCRTNKNKSPKRPWRAVIRIDKSREHLGFFETELEAAKAYDAAAIRLHGEFATLNFPEQLDSRATARSN